MVNPFKIKTTYITAIIYTLLFFLVAEMQLLAKILYFPTLLFAALIIPESAGLEAVGTAFVIFLIVTPIVGFLIGWLIHKWFIKR